MRDERRHSACLRAVTYRQARQVDILLNNGILAL